MPRMRASRVAAGVDAIVVSNHGGRQLDGATSTIAALPRVVEAARDAARCCSMAASLADRTCSRRWRSARAAVSSAALSLWPRRAAASAASRWRSTSSARELEISALALCGARDVRNRRRRHPSRIDRRTSVIETIAQRARAHSAGGGQQFVDLADARDRDERRGQVLERHGARLAPAPASQSSSTARPALSARVTPLQSTMMRSRARTFEHEDAELARLARASRT